MTITPALRLCLASLPALAGCSTINLSGNSLSIDYTLDAQHFPEDIGQNAGTFPTVACASSATCMAPASLAGAVPSCNGGKCAATVTVRTAQSINLTSEKGFPAQVANSSVVQYVQVKSVAVYAPSNTLNTDTPPIQIYVGPASATKETDANVHLLGTLPPVAKGQAVPQSSPLQLSLTDEGKGALATFAQAFRTPFNVIAVAPIAVGAGQALPSGKIDLYVQPTLAFVVTL